jgi:hypothetical protein
MRTAKAAFAWKKNHLSDLDISRGKYLPHTLIHPRQSNSYALRVVDPTLADTATGTMRTLHEPELLPVLVRELTEPTP